MNSPFKIVKPEQESAGERQDNNEHGLIGCAILAPEETRQSCGWLQAGTLHDERSVIFWQRFTAGDDPWAILVDLGTGYCFEATGWMNDAQMTSAPHHARQIAQAAHLCDMAGDAAQLAHAVACGNYKAAQDAIRALAEMTPATGKTVHDAVDVAWRFAEALESGNRTIPTYMPHLDKAIAGGLERQTLSILASRPSMGKSAIALQVARNVAASHNRVIFFSLEMSETNLWARAACPLIGLTWADVKALVAAGSFTPAQRDTLLARSIELAQTYGHNLLVHDEQSTTDVIWEVTATERPALVIVDHLRYIRDQAGDNENKRLGLITSRMKQMSKRLDCHVMILAQLNRRSEDRGVDDKRPQLADLRDSGEIEEDADLVLMPYREGYYKPALEEAKSRTELWVRKNRDGELNVLVNLLYDKKAQWFEPAQ